MAESKEKLKSLLMKVKKKNGKAGLKLNIQKRKIMAYGPITSWHIDREKMKTVSDFIFLSSKITADSNCSHKIKRPLLLGRKAMTNLDSILKSRDITLLTKVCLVKAIVFPAVMYASELDIHTDGAEDLQSFPASGSFPMSRLFPSGDESIGASASAPVLAMNV